MAKPRIYTFGPVFKTLLILTAVTLMALGLWGVMQAYTHGTSVLAQFCGVLLSLLPMALALIGTPMVWRCRLTLFDDHLEYRGLVMDAVIQRSEIRHALAPRQRFGLFWVFLILAEEPLKRLNIAILGRVDDTLSAWVKALPKVQLAKL